MGKGVVEIRGPDAQRIEREAPAGGLARRRDHQADRAGYLGDAGRGDDELGLRNPPRGDREEGRGRDEMEPAGIALGAREQRAERGEERFFPRPAALSIAYTM